MPQGCKGVPVPFPPTWSWPSSPSALSNICAPALLPLQEPGSTIDSDIIRLLQCIESESSQAGFHIFTCQDKCCSLSSLSINFEAVGGQRVEIVPTVTHHGFSALNFTPRLRGDVEVRLAYVFARYLKYLGNTIAKWTCLNPAPEDTCVAGLCWSPGLWDAKGTLWLQQPNRQVQLSSSSSKFKRCARSHFFPYQLEQGVVPDFVMHFGGTVWYWWQNLMSLAGGTGLLENTKFWLTA